MRVEGTPRSAEKPLEERRTGAVDRRKERRMSKNHDLYFDAECVREEEKENETWGKRRKIKREKGEKKNRRGDEEREEGKETEKGNVREK